MNIEFECDLSIEQQNQVKNSVLLNKWLKRVQQKYQVHSLCIQSVDFKGKSIPLFIKLNANASTLDGNRALGICLLRGDAVAVLPILICEGQNYLLLIRQSRFPVADNALLEIPAGMLDLETDPIAVAVKEMHEETGFEISKEELIDLNVKFDGEEVSKPMWASSGLLDEAVYLYALERKVSKGELEELNGKTHGIVEEGEIIHTEIIKESALLNSTQDSKTLLAYLLWKNKK